MKLENQALQESLNYFNRKLEQSTIPESARVMDLIGDSEFEGYVLRSPGQMNLKFDIDLDYKKLLENIPGEDYSDEGTKISPLEKSPFLRNPLDQGVLTGSMYFHANDNSNLDFANYGFKGDTITSSKTGVGKDYQEELRQIVPVRFLDRAKAIQSGDSVRKPLDLVVDLLEYDFNKS